MQGPKLCTARPKTSIVLSSGTMGGANVRRMTLAACRSRSGGLLLGHQARSVMRAGSEFLSVPPSLWLVPS